MLLWDHSRIYENVPDPEGLFKRRTLLNSRRRVKIQQSTTYVVHLSVDDNKSSLRSTDQSRGDTSQNDEPLLRCI